MDLCAWPKETVQTCHAVLIRRAWRRKWCIAPVPSVTHSPCPPALSFQHTLKQPCRLGFILFSKGKPGSFVIGLCEKPSLVYSFYKIQFGWRIRKYGALFLTFFNEKKKSQMSDTDGNDFKTFSSPLMFTCIFVLFTVKGQTFLR